MSSKMKHNLSKFTLILLATELVLVANNCTRSKLQPWFENTKFPGGTYTVIEKHPFYAGVFIKPIERYDLNFQNEELLCGSSIIGQFWAITSGGCLFLIAVNEIDISDVFLKSGTSFANASEETVTGLRVHDADSVHILDNDVNLGLIRVQQGFVGHGQIKVKLASKRYHIRQGSSCVILGFEAIGKYVPVNRNLFKKVDLIVLGDEECMRSSHVQFSESVDAELSFCAKWPRTYNNTCYFEPGSPVVQNDVLIGVMNGAIMCGPNKIFRYVKVSKFQTAIVYHQIRVQERIGVVFVDN